VPRRNLRFVKEIIIILGLDSGLGSGLSKINYHEFKADSLLPENVLNDGLIFGFFKARSFGSTQRHIKDDDSRQLNNILIF
tara:strand:+ start:298 stop:540 length:243 start_codon:yes stop_codon:yes gene_type:complete